MVVGKPWQQECEAVVHMAFIFRKQRGEFLSSAHFLLFIQPGTPDYETALGTSRMITPSLQGPHCVFAWGNASSFPLLP